MDAQKTAEKLEDFIRDQVRAASCRGVVLGLSGGIDSSVLGVLCKRVFPDTTLGIIMPCYSIPADEEHARLLAEKFAIRTEKVVLDGVYDTCLKAFPDFQTEPSRKRLAGANLKARLRMITLYHAANQLQYLVAGSGNCSELTIGYFTKHGDSGVDMLPLGNLVKSEVRELARYLGVPDIIITKPPSAGLWEGQTDEDEMGFTYEGLDRYIRTGEAPDDLKAAIEARRVSCAHKCLTPPVPPA